MAKDRTIPDEIRDAAIGLRIAGMSERAIYEGLRDALAEVPSYRDLRAAYAEFGVSTRTEAANFRREGIYPESLGRMIHGRYVAITHSDYRERRAEMLTIDKTASAVEKFDRKYILGFLAKTETDPDLLDDGPYQESLADIYDSGNS